MADYNGWSNRATWNVSLWLNNEEGTYNELQRLTRHAASAEALAGKIEELCKAIWGDKTPDGDALSQVDWQEIADGEWSDSDHEEPEETPRTSLDQFIAKHGILFEAHRVATRPDGLMESDPKNPTRHFRCRIKVRPLETNLGLTYRDTRSFGLYFSQGSTHTTEPTLAEVLDCLASDASGYEQAKDVARANIHEDVTFDNWASEYGYDTDSRKAEKTFRTVKRQAEQLKRTLGEAAYKELLWETERQ
jgi:hypothetical protein